MQIRSPQLLFSSLALSIGLLSGACGSTAPNEVNTDAVDGDKVEGDKITINTCEGPVQNLGEECSSTDPDEPCPCGGEGVCLGGVCREKCATDAECSGQICLTESTGETSRGGCRLASERACEASDECPALLSCGLDESCRTPCDSEGQCPRNDQVCIADTCYSDSEPTSADWECDGKSQGSYRCDRRELQICNVGALGWSTVTTCETEAACESGIKRDEADCVAAPQLVSAMPSDGSEDVDTTTNVALVFSESIAPESITGSALSFRANGQTVAGEWSIEDNAIQFVPDAPLALLTEYTIEIAGTLEDLSGDAIDGPSTHTFTTRDGTWSAPIPFGTSAEDPVQELRVLPATDGTALAIWLRESTPQVLYSSTIDANGTWSTPTPLSDDKVDVDHYSGEAFARGPDGTALVTWVEDGKVRGRSYDPGTGWSGASTLNVTDGDGEVGPVRFDRQGNGAAIFISPNGTTANAWVARYSPAGGWATAEGLQPRFASAAELPWLAVSPGGNLLAMWKQNTTNWTNYAPQGEDFAGAQELVTQGEGVSLWGIKGAFANDDKAVVAWSFAANVGGRDGVVASLDPSSGWTVATEPPHPDSIVFDDSNVVSDNQGNLIVLWNSFTNNDMWANFYDSVDGFQSAARLDNGIVNTAGTYTTEFDRSGNGFTAWNDTLADEMSVRRYVKDGGWKSTQDFAPATVSYNQRAFLGVSDKGDAWLAWCNEDTSYTARFQ